MQKMLKNKKWLLAICAIILILTCLAPAFGASITPLKQGSSGQAVKDVQQKLKQWDYYSGTVDGIFGSGTKEAVKKFQRNNGLTPDGIVGKSTFEALGLNQYVNNSSNSVSGTNTTNNNDEVTLLAKAIFAEAEGEPYIGKVAVGAVLLNRVKNNQFPNTLAGVIYQGNALESVSNGRFYTFDNHEESVKAAKDALAGWDPSYGSLYFWNPAKVPANSWIWTRQVIVTIGNHSFGK